MSKNQSPEMDTGDKITFAILFGFPLLLLIIFMTGKDGQIESHQVSVSYYI